jgi:hypothetical protein
MIKLLLVRPSYSTYFEALATKINYCFHKRTVKIDKIFLNLSRCHACIRDIIEMLQLCTTLLLLFSVLEKCIKEVFFTLIHGCV